LQTISVSTPSLTIAADGTKPSSRIMVAGTNGVDFHKIRFEARNEALTLKKVTLEITTASSTVWVATSTVPNFGTVYLYDGALLLGSGTFNSTNATVAISGFTVTLPQDTEKILTVKVDVTNSGPLVPKTVVAMRNYSTSTDDMEVYSSQGLLAGTSISVTSNAQSSFMLFHDTAPTMANALSSGTRSPGTNQEIGKFTVTNSAPAGGRTLYVDQLAIVVSLSSAGPGGAVTTFRLYDDGGTLIATSSEGEISLTSSTTPQTKTFASSSASWTEQAVSAGTSRTFTLKADTTAIRTGVTTGNVYLSTKVDGTKGYLSTDIAGPDEVFWNDGGLNYHYVQASTLTGFFWNQASDSYQVDGATLQYP
jgi:hypothetical protein